jgi:hypothetical protein
VKHETYQALRAGLDTRPWLVLGGPLDGLQVRHFDYAHLCMFMSVPYVRHGIIQFAVHDINHDDHLLEFNSESQPSKGPPHAI